MRVPGVWAFICVFVYVWVRMRVSASCVSICMPLGMCLWLQFLFQYPPSAPTRLITTFVCIPPRDLLSSEIMNFRWPKWGVNVFTVLTFVCWIFSWNIKNISRHERPHSTYTLLAKKVVTPPLKTIKPMWIELLCFHLAEIGMIWTRDCSPTKSETTV